MTCNEAPNANGKTVDVKWFPRTVHLPFSYPSASYLTATFTIPSDSAIMTKETITPALSCAKLWNQAILERLSCGQAGAARPSAERVSMAFSMGSPSICTNLTSNAAQPLTIFFIGSKNI